VKKDEPIPSTSTTSWRAYRISNLGSFTWGVSTPVTPMPLPEDSHEANMLVKMEGNTANISANWKMTEGTNFGTFTDTGTSQSFSNDGVTYDSIGEVNEFKSNFLPETMTTGYSIYVVDESINSSLMNDNGTITQLSFSADGDSPVVWNASLSFVIGDNITLFEADVPDRPSAVTMATTGTTKEVLISWTPFDGYASVSDSVSATGIEIQYRKSTTTLWKTVTTGMVASGGLGCDDCTTVLSLPNNRTITLTETGEYQFRIALLGENTKASRVKHYRQAVDSDDNKTLTVI
jgi:hypothetical protein